MKSIGVGVVGCGFVGRGAHVPAFASIEGSELAAVADPDDKRRTKAATKHKAKSAYKDYVDLVKDPAVNLVVVASPTPLHAKMSLAAIEAGKHVLCEMPLAPSLEEADQLIAATDKAGVLLLPSLTFRFTPTFVKVKEMIAEGAIGQPAAMIYRENIPASDLAMQWPAASWMWKREESGGPLYTLAVWSTDLVRWLFETEVVETTGAVKYTPLEQFGGTFGYDAFASLELANGMVASLQYSGSVASSASSNWLEVVGDSTGVLHAESNESVTLYGKDPAKSEWVVKQHGAKMWGHYQQDEHFIQCLLEGKTPSVTPDDGRKAMVIAEQIAK